MTSGKTLFTALLLTLSIHSIALADQYRLELKLIDDSRLHVIRETPLALTLNTKLGEVKADLSLVTSLQILDKGEKMVVHFKNKDRLTGTPQDEGIYGKTVFGKHMIPFDSITQVTVRPYEKPWLRAVGVKASGSWSKYKAENLIDDNPNTGWNAGRSSGWVEIDLGKVVDISEIRFQISVSPATTNMSYTIKAANSPIGSHGKGSTIWSTGKRVKNGETLINNKLKTKARYLQIKGSGGSWYSIEDLKVR